MTNFGTYNQAQTRTFTSTGDKLLFHDDALRDLREGKNHPIVLHIMPTEKCNLNCSFCSVAQRGHYDDLTLRDIQVVVDALLPLGLKAIILSGGGEPLLYPQINELINYLTDNGLEIGLITNGTVFRKLTPACINAFTWIRISVNALDYVDDIDVPSTIPPNTTLGFSYIWGDYTTEESLQRIQRKIKEIRSNHDITYVRLLPDCNLETSELERAHGKLRELAEKLGEPFFHQYKIHEMPEECHLGRVHPVLYTDRKIYPCDSLVLNSPLNDRRFHQDYALCDVETAGEFFARSFAESLIDTMKCPHCVFARQNRILKRIVDGEDVPKPKHKPDQLNFI